LAIKYELRTYADFVEAVKEELSIPTNDTIAIRRVKRDLNIVYKEIQSAHNWQWLKKTTTVITDPYIGSTGTASVSQNSATVTLTAGPAASQKGKLFSTTADSSVYSILSHTAGSTTLVLETPYTNATNSAVSYKIWSNKITMPVEARDIVQATHAYLAKPMEFCGQQEFRRLEAEAPKGEGRPIYCSLGDYINPDPYETVTGLSATQSRSAAGLIRTIVFASTVESYFKEGDRINITGAGSPSYNGEWVIASVNSATITFTAKIDLQESTTTDTGMTITIKSPEKASKKFREFLIYPSISEYKTPIRVDYIRGLDSLVEDDDEPAMPEEQRAVLLYGALHRAWSRVSNPEEAARNLQLFTNALMLLKGKQEPNQDKPEFKISAKYLSAKRSVQSSNPSLKGLTGAAFSSGGSPTITGTANRVAVFNTSGELISEPSVGDITVTSGVCGITPGAIVNADVNSSAAIVRSKLASGTAYRILANDSAGVASENAALTATKVVISDANGQLASSAVTPTELTYLTDADPWTTFSMVDNQSSAANIATWAHASYKHLIIDYTLARGSGIRETGTIYLATDGSTAGIGTSSGGIGSTGVTFSVDISGSDLRLRYTSTSSGTAPTMRYSLRKVS
jgi:hypothetical protein